MTQKNKAKRGEKCNHKWVLGMQSFMKYPKVTAQYICLKCKEEKEETH